MYMSPDRRRSIYFHIHPCEDVASRVTIKTTDILLFLICSIKVDIMSASIDGEEETLPLSSAGGTYLKQAQGPAISAASFPSNKRSFKRRCVLLCTTAPGEGYFFLLLSFSSRSSAL